MFERLDQAAQDALSAAYDDALRLGDNAIGTEHVLLALASTGSVAARLLREAGFDADVLRLALTTGRTGHDQRRDHAMLLGALGIDLAKVREQAEQTFGAEALNRMTARARPPGPRRTLWSRISCAKPQPLRRCDSPLAGRQLGVIPRVKRLLERATRDARPSLATPGHLLLALITGNEPACELLAARGVDLNALANETRRAIGSGNTGGRLAG
jgi:hypothetical protein